MLATCIKAKGNGGETLAAAAAIRVKLVGCTHQTLAREPLLLSWYVALSKTVSLLSHAHDLKREATRPRPRLATAIKAGIALPCFELLPLAPLLLWAFGVVWGKKRWVVVATRKPRKARIVISDTAFQASGG